MSLTPECLEQLGLRAEPFGPVPEDSALYRDALLDGFSELALRALAEPSAMLVLAGAGGVGRSTQLRQILSLLADDIELIAFRARPRVGFEAVDATLRFHLSQLGSEDASASLLHLLGERLRTGHALLLAIDDAHLLSVSVLEHLLSLRRQLLERLGATARFFLVGDPPFAANPLPGLDVEADTRVLRLHLRAFNPEQTHAYLRHRLLTAGHPQPEALLKRELVDRLHRGSSGLPKYLNALAEDWLVEYCDQHASFAETIPDALPGAGGLAGSAASSNVATAPPADAMVSAMTALEALRNKSSQALEAAEQDTSRRPGSGGASGGGNGAQFSAPADRARPETGRERGSKHDKRSKTGTKPRATPAGEKVPIWNRPWFVPGVAVFSLFALLLPLIWQLPGSDGAGSAGRSRDLPNARRAPVAPGVPLVTPQTASSTGSSAGLDNGPHGGSEKGSQNGSGVAASEAVLESGLPPGRELRVPEILPGNSAAEGAASAETLRSDASGTSASDAPSGDSAHGGERAGAGVTTPGAATDGAGDVSADARGGTAAAEAGATGAGAERGAASVAGEPELDRDWILRQSGEHFTIQLAAARSVAAAKQHVQGFRDQDFRFVPTRSKSQDFVVVLAGVYPARADAERALERLPAGLREQGYWIRSVASVRQSLRQ